MTEFYGPLPTSKVATVTQARGFTRGLGAGSGVYAADVGLYATDFACSDGGDLDVSVAAGESSVDGIYYTSDAVQTVTLDAADGSNPRIDLVVVELDPVAGTVALAKVTGTPAASPSAPSVTEEADGVFQVALAEVTVPSGSAVLGTITDVREFITPGGSATSGVENIFLGFSELVSDQGTPATGRTSAGVSWRAWLIATGEAVAGMCLIPDGWNTVEVDFWVSSQAGTGNMRLYVYYDAKTDTETISGGVSQDVIAAASGSDIIDKVTVTGTPIAVAAGDLLSVTAFRDAASDTVAGDIALYGINVRKVS